MNRWALVAAGGVLTVLAYPPFHLLVPSFICLLPALTLMERAATHPAPRRRAFANGYWYGLAAHGLVLYWMVFALWHFTPLAAMGYAATIAILAAWTGAAFLATAWIRRHTRLPLILVLPTLWTAVEWAIGHQGDIRFPWLGLGTSLTGFPLLVQVADLVGARGVTFLLVMANVALWDAWHRRRTLGGAARLLAVAGAVLAALSYGAWRTRSLELIPLGRVAVTQPNIGFEGKWEEGRHDEIFASLLDISRAAVATRPDLVVWPEAAVPDYFHLRPDWERAIARHSRDAGVPLVVGGLDFERYGPERDAYDYWNAAFVFDPVRGRRAIAYHKRFLVPMTERVPFINPRLIDLDFFGGFSVGGAAPVFRVGTGAFGILICYESAFPAAARRYRRAGADFLVNITNDAWFGNTSAPRQHLAHLVMRAIETRMGAARSANTGISAFVDPLGRVSARTALGVRTFRAATVFGSDARTLVVRLGDWVGVASVAGAGIMLVLAAWRRR